MLEKFKSALVSRKHTVILYEPSKGIYSAYKMSLEEIQQLQSTYKQILGASNLISILALNLRSVPQRLALFSIETILLGYEIGKKIDPDGVLPAGKRFSSAELIIALTNSENATK